MPALLGGVLLGTAVTCYLTPVRAATTSLPRQKEKKAWAVCADVSHSLPVSGVSPKTAWAGTMV